MDIKGRESSTNWFCNASGELTSTSQFLGEWKVLSLSPQTVLKKGVVARQEEQRREYVSIALCISPKVSLFLLCCPLGKENKTSINFCMHVYIF